MATGICVFSRREKGMALLMVMVLMVVMVLVISELLSGARVQRLSTENLVDDHFVFYGEQAALIRVEEVLFQDIEPPPKRSTDELFLTPEQLRLEQKKVGTDSFHDHWATMKEVEKLGESWMKVEVSDEERRFNVNTLVDQRTGQLLPKRKAFLEALFKALDMKETESKSLIEEFKDILDPNDTGKYESKTHNGPLKLLSQILDFEELDEELYYGKNYPSGELVTQEDVFALEDKRLEVDFDSEEDLEEGSESKEQSPFKEDEIPEAYEDWDDEEIYPGLKDVLTIYGDGKINLNTAPLPILVALLKGDEKAALEIIRARKEAPLAGHEDLKRVTGASQLLGHFADMVTYQSQYFRVLVTIQQRRVRRFRMSMMMREGSNATTLFRGAPL
jgi:type II secretory pathway component PulK